MSHSQPKDPYPPLTDEEQEAVRLDLADLHLFESYLAPCGVKGLVVLCDECSSDHFHTWFELRRNLSRLVGGMPPEEAHNNPDDAHCYVSWDFCRGYAAHASGTFSVFE